MSQDENKMADKPARINWRDLFPGLRDDHEGLSEGKLRALLTKIELNNPRVQLFIGANFEGAPYITTAYVDELPDPYIDEISSIIVTVRGWVTFHSKVGRRGSHLCVQGPATIPNLRNIVKINVGGGGFLGAFVNGNWNDDIQCVDAIASADRPYVGDYMATYIDSNWR